MKTYAYAFSLALLLGTTLLIPLPARAGNRNIEAALQSFGDLSGFYQALLNTGVINELTENQHYTVFAPTNAALAQITPQAYPCFYAPQCRPQIASLLRGHILMGRHDTPMLVTYGQGIQSLNGTTIHVREPYVNDFTVDNRTILSKTETGGNVIYRIDGVLASPQDLAQFQTATYAQPAPPPVIVPTTTIATQRIMTTYDPTTTPLEPNPANTAAEKTTTAAPDNATETTTVITGYTTTDPTVQ